MVGSRILFLVRLYDLGKATYFLDGRFTIRLGVNGVQNVVGFNPNSTWLLINTKWDMIIDEI